LRAGENQGFLRGKSRLYRPSKRRCRVLARQRKRHYTFARRIGINRRGPDMARHRREPQPFDMPDLFV
jgi:hypothetical protein